MNVFRNIVAVLLVIVLAGCLLFCYELYTIEQDMLHPLHAVANHFGWRPWWQPAPRVEPRRFPDWRRDPRHRESKEAGDE